VTTLERILASCFVFMVVVFAACGFSPTGRGFSLRSSPAHINESIRRELPTAASRSDVLAYMDDLGARRSVGSESHGFYREDGSLACDSFIRFNLGQYRNFFSLTDVVVNVGFGAAERICEVEVRKFIDAP